MEVHVYVDEEGKLDRRKHVQGYANGVDAQRDADYIKKIVPQGDVVNLQYGSKLNVPEYPSSRYVAEKPNTGNEEKLGLEPLIID